MSAAEPFCRRAGVLLHPTSLPSPYGSGDFGHAAFRFIEFLQAAGFGLWQVLPLGPVRADLSPYNAPSVHAGNPQLISLDWLRDRGLVENAELYRLRREPACRAELLARAAQRFAERLHGDAALADRFAAFRAPHATWLPDYALYVALHEVHDGVPFQQWPCALRDRDPDALGEARIALAARIEALAFEQYAFHAQWSELRAYAAARGIRVLGDAPIFVAPDSAEVWAHRELFRLDADGSPLVEAGVPPDYFSAEGQRWGNPHYAWERHRQDGFAWWRERIAGQLARFDLLRIDHFRGFEACWEIPCGARSAAEGRWAKAPGAALLDALCATAGPDRLVAENLGVITPAVEQLRRSKGLPGMRVLQFAFDGDPGNLHLPHNHEPGEIVYTGTHDNDTTLGWFRSLPSATREGLLDYLGNPEEAMPWPLIRAALASVARLAVLPLQDLLGLDDRGRMNVPGLAEGNWTWQFEAADLDPVLAARTRKLLSRYGRLAGI